MDMREKLLQKRGQLLAEAEGLLDTATRTGRGLTDAEKARHDRLVAQAKEINASLTANAAIEREAAVTVPVSQTTAMAVAQGTMPAEPTRAARPGQTHDGVSFATYFASQGRHSFAGGGVLIPQEVFNPWVSLAPTSVAIAAGVRVLPIADGTIIPSVSSRPEAVWMGTRCGSGRSQPGSSRRTTLSVRPAPRSRGSFSTR
jgi:hypothetical protein